MKTKAWTREFCKAMLVLLLFTGMAESTTMPVFEDMSLNNVKLTAPSHAATSPDGKMYFVEALKNRVAVYSRKGGFAGSISVQYPSSIAINQNGLIYIGSDKDFSVAIFNSSGTKTGQLGTGAGEFRRPCAIAIDPANRNVLVVDSLAGAIRIYNENGAFVRNIPIPAGLPVDLTVYNNEIYLINLPSLAGATVSTLGGNYKGAKVDVLNMDGALLRSFVSYGMDPGQMINPAAIANDSIGRIYITDSYQGVVFCYYGPTGQYLGAVHNPSSPLLTPIGVDVAPDNRLIVVSLNTSNFKVFGLDNYTFLTASPSSLAFTAKEGLENPAGQSVAVGNSGRGSLTYTAAADNPWILLQNAAGTVQARGSADMTVGIDASALSPGDYKGKVTITDNSGAVEIITVSLHVAKSPKLTISPAQLAYIYNTGSAVPAPQMVEITLYDDISNAAVWTATAGSSWLAVSPSFAAGNSTTQAAVSIDPAGLSEGTYMGTISIAADDTLGSPAVVTVTLTVKSAGTINVTTNLDEAGFAITGPANLSGTGRNWSAANLPAGTYTISYYAVSGYITPRFETKTVVAGSATGFNGDYKVKVVRNIVVSPGYSNDQRSTVRVFGADGTMQQETRIAGPKYTTGYNIALGDINADGLDEIITGLGPDPKYQAKVMAADQQGNNLPGSAFEAFLSKSGARVATGNFSRDGKAAIIVGSGPDSNNSAQLRVFVYENNMIMDTGVNIIPFSTKYGVTAAAGDLDGDGLDELIVAPGPDPNADALVRVFKVDTSGGLGAWTVYDTGLAFTAFPGNYGANTAVADLNGDGKAEIIVTSGSHANVTVNRIAAFYANGQPFGLVIIDNSSGGLEVAAGDIDQDGNAEIVTAHGPKSSNSSIVNIYRADGALVSTFKAFETSTYGAKVSIGKIGR